MSWGSVIRHLAFILFPLALLWRPLFAGEAFFWGTPLLQFVPWQQLASDMWRSGHLPLWNPLVGCGAPLAANYQTAAFYPLNALYLVTRAEVALSWTVAFHVALTGWAMYRWSRAMGLDPFPALIGALALEGSGFLVARAALFPSIAITFPWIPIWLWRAEILVQHGHRTESEGVRGRDALWLGLTIGLGLMAGHAQTAFYGGLLVATYSVFRAMEGIGTGSRQTVGRPDRPNDEPALGRTRPGPQPRFSILCLLLLSLILGLGLAAVQILPTAQLLVHSQRTAGVDTVPALTYSFWPWRLITVAAPDFFGNPGEGTYWGYGAYWEDATYVGLLPLLLAVGAVIGARRSRARFLAVSIVASLILALGKNSPIFPFLFRYVPGFDLFRAPARWLVIATVALAALAAIGAQAWPRGRRARRRGALGLTLGGALLIGGLTAPRIAPGIPTTFGPATTHLGIGLLVAGGLSLLRGRARRAPNRDAIWWQAMVGAFVAIDLLSFGWPLVPTVDRSLYRGKTRTAAVLNGEGVRGRVYWPSDPDHQNQTYDAQHRVKFDYLTFDDFGPEDTSYWRGMREAQLPNAGMLDGMASANNFDPLLIGEYEELLAAADEAPVVLEVMGVTHVASDRPWPGGARTHTSDSVAFYRLPGAPGRAWVVHRGQHIPHDEVLNTMKTPAFDPARTVLLDDRLSEEERAVHAGTSASSLVQEGRSPPPLTRLPGIARSRPVGRGKHLSTHDPLGAGGAGRDFHSDAPALQDGPNQVTIHAALDAPGYLVLADAWYPGWHVTVDGRPAELLRANHAFRAVHLTDGKHTIDMVYRPSSVLIGGSISIATGIVLVVGMLINISRREKS